MLDMAMLLWLWVTGYTHSGIHRDSQGEVEMLTMESMNKIVIKVIECQGAYINM